MLVVGAQALVDALTDGAAVQSLERRPIELEAIDAEDRLVRWLNEVLVLASLDGFVVADAEVQLHEGGLRAEVVGQPDALALLCNELKSVTYHGVELRHEGDRVVGTVVVDV